MQLTLTSLGRPPGPARRAHRRWRGVRRAPPALVAAAALAASAPSWISLAGAAAGAPRLQGGPVGKTERCLLLVLVAGTGWVVPLLAVLAAGSLLTATLRWHRLRAVLR